MHKNVHFLKKMKENNEINKKVNLKINVKKYETIYDNSRHTRTFWTASMNKSKSTDNNNKYLMSRIFEFMFMFKVDHVEFYPSNYP